ncbi:MAG TPA: HAMP domain-containing histidine kinase [Candidatus Fimivivens faecavium]|nr:HAMP domain-containing histidine kinase [Candidatus Fimivivens faecavium]
MDKWMFILGILCVLTAAVLIYINYRNTKKTMETIGRMLDAAAEGAFQETAFDESRLSALETKYAHYLSSSAVSAQNLTIEKDKIKTLIADISHQTKTPIANLLLYSELLAEEELTDDVRANANAIRQQAEKLRFLIDSLVKLSRLENGILALSPHLQAVGPMLDDINKQYASKARSKGLQLEVIPTGAFASFDRKWTAEALGNLIDNAIKYTPSGSVTVKTSEYEIFTRIDVADTGIGVDEFEQTKVFTRFYRSEVVRENEGVGIGLYLAREIISGEGGYIKLVSERGKGSTFSIFLPRQSEIFQNC